MTSVKNHFPTGNDLKTVLLHNSAFLCVTRFLPLSPFGFANAFPLSHSVSFLPFYSVIPETLSNFVSVNFRKAFKKEIFIFSDTFFGG